MRMVANLRNVDEDLAQRIATGLGLDEVPAASTPVKAPIELPPSPALSIVQNGPAAFAGRKVGALVTDGSDVKLLAALRRALTKEGALLELIAPTVGGIVGSDGERVLAHHAVAGGPSVLFDAVAVLPSADGAAVLAADPHARDFVADALAHAKFVGHNDDARTLFAAAGITDDQLDGGFVALTARTVTSFVTALADLRWWERELATQPA
jgi:catalase